METGIHHGRRRACAPRQKRADSLKRSRPTRPMLQEAHQSAMCKSLWMGYNQQTGSKSNIRFEQKRGVKVLRWTSFPTSFRQQEKSVVGNNASGSSKEFTSSAARWVSCQRRRGRTTVPPTNTRPSRSRARGQCVLKNRRIPCCLEALQRLRTLRLRTVREQHQTPQ